jgi:regulatory protein
MPAGTITALQAQAHDQQRVNVFIDNAFALGVSLNTVSRERLYVGKQLSEPEFERLEQAERGDQALHVAMRFIETRPRSRTEIHERLRSKGFDEPQIEHALTRLNELDLANDASFARFWVENRLACRPRGAGVLRDELRRKGVDRNVIDATLAELAPRSDEHERALTLARAAARKYASAPDRYAFQRRLGGYLQRRGFQLDLIRPIVDQLWREEHSTVADTDDDTYDPELDVADSD